LSFSWTPLATTPSACSTRTDSSARALRDRKPDLPVLLVTGFGEAAGEVGQEFVVMRKPFDLADLSRIAARMIADAKQPPDANVVQLHDARRSALTRKEEK
jgi:FixJ family two-component response regulator